MPENGLCLPSDPLSHRGALEGAWELRQGLRPPGEAATVMSSVSVMVGLYLGTGILWTAWNVNSDFTRREMSRPNASWAMLLLGIILGTILWPVWAGIGLWLIVENRRNRWKGGDLP